VICVTGDERTIILGILDRLVPECEVRVFGSRRNGPHKPWSDLDLVVAGDIAQELSRMGELQEAFAESDLPYRVDVLDWHAIPQRFRDNILRGGYEVLKEASVS